MLLKRGIKSEEVKQLQQKLGLPSDGQFGEQTELAVKEWQRKYGLLPDGIVGNMTWEKMFDPKIDTVVESIKPLDDNQNIINKLIWIIPATVLNELPDTFKVFNITSPLRIAHFLSQCGHESGSFKFVRENLNYPPEGLLKVFGKYFNSQNVMSYARNPEKIASRVYANRMGNGDEESGDGYKFRGRGYLQVTGKDSYRAFGKKIDVDLISNPDLIATTYPLLSAAWFFDTNGLIKMSDNGSSEDVIKLITKRVNGGFNGLDDRIIRFNKIYQLIK